MISPSRPGRNTEPPAPGLNVRRSDALEEARRRSRPRDISSGTETLSPSSECGSWRREGYLGDVGGTRLIRWERRVEDKRLSSKFFKDNLHFICSVPLAFTAVSLLQRCSSLSPVLVQHFSAPARTDTVRASVCALPVCTQTWPTFCKHPCVYTLKGLRANTPLHLCEIPRG